MQEVAVANYHSFIAAADACLLAIRYEVSSIAFSHSDFRDLGKRIFFYGIKPSFVLC
jgi:hypothetical protein